MQALLETNLVEPKEKIYTGYFLKLYAKARLQGLQQTCQTHLLFILMPYQRKKY